MEIKTSEQIADHITERLFKLGSEPDSNCHRIEFKVGGRIEERGAGGLCKDAFRQWLRKELAHVPSELEG